MTRKEFIAENEELVAEMIRENIDELIEEIVSNVTVYPQEPSQVVLTLEHYIDELMSDKGIEVTF